MAGFRDEQDQDGRERRRHARIPADAMPHLSARVVGGPLVRLLDVSRRGARVETGLPLRPGRPVTIRFVAADATLTLTGAVVRSSVAVLAEEGVKYHTALAFAEDVALCPEVLPEPVISDRPSPTGHRPAPESSPDTDDVMVVPTPEATGDTLRERLLANSW